MHVSLRRGLAAGAALLTLALVGGPVVPAAAASTTPAALPAPTGPHQVGATSLYLRDTSRADPWVPTVNARELMVTVFYPARANGEPQAQYMTPAESRTFLEHEEIPNVPTDALAAVRTHVLKDATPTGRRHGLPLVVLSPGFTQNRAILTGLAEDLASHGYVVAAVEHTYESRAASFPDGRVATCAACEVDDQPGFWAKLAAVHSADVSFVLDRLTGRQPAWSGAALIDPSRIALAGHSAGGAAATLAMLNDPRLRAGIDIDGTTHVPIPDSGLSRPFMFFGGEHFLPGTGDTSWSDDWPNLTGWRRWFVVAGAAHASFTDAGVFADVWGVDIGAEVTGVRATQLTRSYVRAFLDRHLRNVPRPLLDRTSPRYPEVTLYQR